MSFQPVVPFGGYAGWAFLSRTRESQQDVFNNAPAIRRDTEYFLENIQNIRSAEELVADRRLLSVALGAFGLDADINNKFFIRKILEEGTIDDQSLANKLSDKRYRALSDAFGFDFDPPHTVMSAFPAKIVDAYQQKQFEIAVGNQNGDMRLALGVGRELAEIAALGSSENAKWFTLMGNAPVRKVFETAFGLPTSFGALNIDQQLSIFKDRAQRMFGSDGVSQFTEPEQQEKLVRQFLIRAEINAASASLSNGSAALMLLQAGRLNAQGLR